MRFIERHKFHFTSSTTNFAHDISRQFQVPHSVNVTRKAVKVAALSTRNSFALLFQRLLLEETRWCLARLARDHRGFMCFSKRAGDRKTRKTRKKKKHLSRRHIPHIQLGVEKQACRSHSTTAAATRNVFSFLFCIFVSSLADLLAPRDYFEIRINYHERIDEAQIWAISIRCRRTHPASLFSPEILSALSCDVDDALFSRQFKLHDCLWPQKINKLIRLERRTTFYQAMEIIHLKRLYSLSASASYLLSHLDRECSSEFTLLMGLRCLESSSSRKVGEPSTTFHVKYNFQRSLAAIQW